jgi:hypothetical protein
MGYFNIVRGMPVPPLGNEPKFPLWQLEIGDSFIAPLSEERRLRRAAGKFNTHHRDRKISVRIVVEGLWCGRIG